MNRLIDIALERMRSIEAGTYRYPDDDAFNGFGEIRIKYNPDAALPDGIPWPVQMEAVPFSYAEGGTS